MCFLFLRLFFAVLSRVFQCCFHVQVKREIRAKWNKTWTIRFDTALVLVCASMIAANISVCVADVWCAANNKYTKQMISFHVRMNDATWRPVDEVQVGLFSRALVVVHTYSSIAVSFGVYLYLTLSIATCCCCLAYNIGRRQKMTIGYRI